jgi:hypothetical protein
VRAQDSAGARPVIRIGPALVLASALASTLGLVIAQFLDDLGDGILAIILGGEAVLYNNRVEIAGASDLAWAGGFLLCLIVGFFALFAYPTQRGHGISRLTLLWMLLHILRQALSQAVMLPFADDSQLSLAYATFDAPPGLDVVIAAGGGVGLLLIALSAASAFLAFTPHRSLVSNGRKRLTAVLWIALVPAVGAAFLAIPYFLPTADSNVIFSLPWTAVMFLATLAAAPGTTTVQGPEDERTTAWPWGLAATLIVILVFYLGVLQGGINLDPRLWG